MRELLARLKLQFVRIPKNATARMLAINL